MLTNVHLLEQKVYVHSLSLEKKKPLKALYNDLAKDKHKQIMTISAKA